jgi:hypothetical protein
MTLLRHDHDDHHQMMMMMSMTKMGDGWQGNVVRYHPTMFDLSIRMKLHSQERIMIVVVSVVPLMMLTVMYLTERQEQVVSLSS